MAFVTVARGQVKVGSVPWAGMVTLVATGDAVTLSPHEAERLADLLRMEAGQMRLQEDEAQRQVDKLKSIVKRAA